jgi:hypothetical protein
MFACRLSTRHDSDYRAILLDNAHEIRQKRQRPYRRNKMTPNKKFALGCTAAVAIPILLIALFIAGLWLKIANEQRVAQHLSVWGSIQKWQAESKAEQEREYKERHMTEREKDEDEASEAKLWGNPAIAHSLRLEREKRRYLDDNRIGWTTVAQLLFFGAIMYLTPSIVAIIKKHPQKISILALNILLGWTLVGWAGALVWALIKNIPQAKV